MKEKGSVVPYIILGILIVFLTLTSVYFFYQKSRDTNKSLPILTDTSSKVSSFPIVNTSPTISSSSGVNSSKCVPREDDITGYLLKICQYIEINNLAVRPADPTKYMIKKIESNWEKGEEILTVYLDCCFMGDRAYVNKKTGEIINFKVGDI